IRSYTHPRAAPRDGTGRPPVCHGCLSRGDAAPRLRQPWHPKDCLSGEAMSTILDRIVASKRKELAEAQAAFPSRELERRLGHAPPLRNFRAALERPGEVAVLAEVKKASPSAGVIRADFDPVAIARTYEKHGAACVSVLTDAPFFQGSLAHLSAVCQAVSL